MGRYRFHVLGLPHIPTNRLVRCCAYSQKLVKLCRMLKESGHEVLFYGGEGSEVECDSFIELVSEAERVEQYGEYDQGREFFRQGNDELLATFNARAVEAINADSRPEDFLLCIGGCWQKPVADGCGLRRVVEPGIGYEGVFAEFQVFESHAWRHYLYGKQGIENGIWHHTVIPNYFDLDEFPVPAEPTGDYYLFMGRLTVRKGLDVAVQVTRELETKLIVAGQGSLVNPEQFLNITDGHVEHVGAVGPEERARLMGNAIAVFAPSYYLEPFGGVNVEAQLCGCPVITSDWGAYPETVEDGVTGFRCRTFAEFAGAAISASGLDRAYITMRARAKWSMDVIRHRYDEYWDLVDDFARHGWYGEARG